MVRTFQKLYNLRISFLYIGARIYIATNSRGKILAKNKCFIIMPISTPENLLNNYSNDKYHFEHVLEHLLKPSLERVDLEPISPKTKGSELIHGEIIKNIEIADLVLCDMSTLNPNVFFELGIRTALNKPVCLIKDDVTPKIPFDASIINHHEYLSALSPWTLDNEINDLVNHIEESQKRNDDTNSLWKYFSLSSTAHPVEPEEGIDGKIDYLTMQIEALRDQLNPPKDMSDELIRSIFTIGNQHGDNIEKYELSGDTLKIYLKERPSIGFTINVENMSRVHGKKLQLMDSSGNLIQ